MGTARRQWTVLLAAGLLAGCSGTGGAEGGEPKLGPVAVNPPTAGLSFPMDAYTDTEAERIRMGQAQQVLVSRCMARYGFAYDGVKSAEAGGGEAEDRHRYLFGSADPAFAAAHGYDKSAGEGKPPKLPAPQLSDSAYVVMTSSRSWAWRATGADPRPSARPRPMSRASAR
ncbi:hypothetical protein ACFWBN_29335 [Streptomyces sp. NPDC059989]|uniref:hypothetical protein n=1 Tax=Streptomyces sp. NPDC059989 TaxID=3347026 RepID=UPI0036B03FF9